MKDIFNSESYEICDLETDTPCLITITVNGMTLHSTSGTKIHLVLRRVMMWINEFQNVE